MSLAKRRDGCVLLLGLAAFCGTWRTAHGWGVTHSHITQSACQMLAPWQRERLKPLIPKLVKTYCMLPDRSYGDSEEVLTEVKPYLYYDAKGWLLHYFPPESDEANRLRATRGFEWVVTRTIAALQAGELDKAARYLGGVSHAIQDASSPIHSLEGPNDLRGIINLLHAPPAEDPYYNVWAAFWQGGCPSPESLITPGYKPRLLGVTPEQIASGLYEGYRDVLFETRRHLIPAINALYRGVPRESPEWQKLWDPMGKVPTRVLADLYHTCLCVAFDRIDPQEVAALKRRCAEAGRTAKAPARSSGHTEPDWARVGRTRLADAVLACLPEQERAQFLPHREELTSATAGASHPRLPSSLGDYPSTARELAFYAREMAVELKAGRTAKAAQLAGALIGQVAERALPVKCLDGQGGAAYQAFSQLFPAPPSEPLGSAASVLARGLDRVEPNTAGYSPRLLGTSPAEAAWWGREAYVRLVKGSCYELTDLVSARYAGDDSRAAAILNQTASRIAQFCADVLHTSVCLAEDRFAADELAKLATVDLTRVSWLRKPGYAGGPYRTQPIVYGASLRREGRKKVPLKLRLPEGGAEEVKVFKRGLGVGGHAKWAFALEVPAGVFESLDIYLGMHATLGNVASYGKKHGEMQLQIALGRKVLYDSGVLTPEKLGAHVVVDVRAGGRLELRMADRSGQWANYGNQVVYGEPMLVRSAQAPRGLGAAQRKR